MDHKERFIYTDWCFNNEIKIYPEPNNQGRHRIIINRGGKEKFTKKVYQDQPVVETHERITPGGKKVKEKKIIPSVWERIDKYYKHFYLKNHPNYEPAI